MERIKQKGNTKTSGQVLLIAIVGLLCLLYLVTTRTTEDQRLIDTLARYCYAHYTLIENPTQKNEHRFLRYGDKLARLSEGKFNYLDEEDVRSFLEPRGYAYDVEEGNGTVDYLLARFIEDGRFEARGPDSVSYDYFLLDRIYVYPYGWIFFFEFQGRKDRSPLIFYARNGRVYIDGGWVRRRFAKLFTRLGESKVTGISKTKIPRSHKILYRGVEEVWREARLFYFSEKATREYFVEHAFEYSIPVILECVSMEQYYRRQKVIGTDGLELSYLRSLMEDPSFITLGLLCYLSENSGKSWARNVINGLEAEGLRELGLENCSLEQIRWAARKAFELKREDLV